LSANLNVGLHEYKVFPAKTALFSQSINSRDNANGFESKQSEGIPTKICFAGMKYSF
jgi:hypothetical protein